ncbi:hypothetical protein TB2_011852 [Malus domestica]
MVSVKTTHLHSQPLFPIPPPRTPPHSLSSPIPPTSDTVFTLLNCSVDSPVLNNYKSLCFIFSGHSCDELCDSCNAFWIFRSGSGLATPTTNPGGFLTNGANSTSTTAAAAATVSPPCCFTGYDTVKFMGMSILDCTHYTSVTNTDELKGLGPLDWIYGIKLSFAVPDTGCDRVRGERSPAGLVGLIPKLKGLSASAPLPPISQDNVAQHIFTNVIKGH